jgi:hypothetical protein
MLAPPTMNPRLFAGFYTVWADCRPPSKDSNFATSDHGRAWYATRKLTLVNATTEVRRSAIAAGLVMA